MGVDQHIKHPLRAYDALERQLADKIQNIASKYIVLNGSNESQWHGDVMDNAAVGRGMRWDD